MDRIRLKVKQEIQVFNSSLKKLKMFMMIICRKLTERVVNLKKSSWRLLIIKKSRLLNIRTLWMKKLMKINNLFQKFRNSKINKQNQFK